MAITPPPSALAICERSALAIECSEARAGIGKSDAAGSEQTLRSPDRRRPPSQHQAGAFPPRADSSWPASARLRDTVPQGVLHKRLEQKSRERRAGNFGRGFDTRPQPVGERTCSIAR